MQLRVAGAQLPVTPDIDANVLHIEHAIDFAANNAAEILLTPEGSLSGYTPEFDPAAVGAALERVTAKAKGSGVGLALGTCFVEPGDGQRYNQLRFYEPGGAFLGFHSKTLLCGTLDDPPAGEINHYAVGPLRTFNFKGITVGGLICNDFWGNPFCTPMDDSYLPRQLGRLGARIIFEAVNGGRGGKCQDICWNFHESNLLLRSMASRLWTIVVDSSEPVDKPCSCPSGVISPDGDWVCKADPAGLQLFVHTIELADDDVENAD